LEEDDVRRDGWVTDEQESKNLRDFVFPVSLGDERASGATLAYMSSANCHRSIVLGFEWELAVPGSERKMIERLNCNPK